MPSKTRYMMNEPVASFGAHLFEREEVESYGGGNGEQSDAPSASLCSRTSRGPFYPVTVDDIRAGLPDHDGGVCGTCKASFKRRDTNPSRGGSDRESDDETDDSEETGTATDTAGVTTPEQFSVTEIDENTPVGLWLGAVDNTRYRKSDNPPAHGAKNLIAYGYVIGEVTDGMTLHDARRAMMRWYSDNSGDASFTPELLVREWTISEMRETIRANGTTYDDPVARWLLQADRDYELDGGPKRVDGFPIRGDADGVHIDLPVGGATVDSTSLSEIQSHYIASVIRDFKSVLSAIRGGDTDE